MYEVVKKLVEEHVFEVEVLGTWFPEQECKNCQVVSSKVITIPLLHPEHSITMDTRCPDCFLELFDHFEELFDRHFPGAVLPFQS